MSDHHDVAILKRELVGLFEHIQKARKEIAAIRRPGQPEKDHFSKMSDELDAIVSATAGATDRILETVEEMEDLIEKVRPMVADPEGRALLDTFSEKSGQIFEACAFQDITGQRITKVVTSLKYVEERVNALISIWGRSQIASEITEEPQPVDEYKKYLNGPQLSGEGVSQSEVDALFDNAPAKPAPTKQQSAPAVKPTAPAPSKPQAPTPSPAKPAAVTKVAQKPASNPQPAPAATAQKKSGSDAGGPTFSQDDIDKLFG